MRLACLAALLEAGACGSSTAPSSSIPPTIPAPLHGEVTDPSGDAAVDARVPVSPDLVHATADVSAGTVTFVIQFVPGTFNPQTTRVSVVLDTDRDGTTGIRQGNGLGADYGLDFVAGSSLAAVTRADPAGCAAGQSCFNAVGSVPITMIANGMQGSVRLSMLGNGDGRFNFQMRHTCS